MKIKFKDLLVNIKGQLKHSTDKLLEREFDEMDIAKAFGFAVKSIRKYKNITLVQMEKDLEIPNPTLSRYENGLNIPSMTQAIKISDYFDIGVNLMIIFGLVAIYENADFIPEYQKIMNALNNMNREIRRKNK